MLKYPLSTLNTLFCLGSGSVAVITDFVLYSAAPGLYGALSEMPF